MAQARSAQLANPFGDLRRAVAANDIVRALGRVGFTQKQIASAAGATDRSVRNWAATGAIRPAYDERIRELTEISLVSVGNGYPARCDAVVVRAQPVARQRATHRSDLEGRERSRQGSSRVLRGGRLRLTCPRPADQPGPKSSRRNEHDRHRSQSPRGITVRRPRSVLDAPNPPFRGGRYHRAEGSPTWYGSSTESAAWAEFARSLPDDVDSSQFQRRLGRADFDLLVLDLTAPGIQRSLGLRPSDLIADDLTVPQTLAELAAIAGFDAVLGPSAAAAGETTLAVFAPAITEKARRVVDRGVQDAA